VHSVPLVRSSIRAVARADAPYLATARIELRTSGTLCTSHSTAHGAQVV